MERQTFAKQHIQNSLKGGIINLINLELVLFSYMPDTPNSNVSIKFNRNTIKLRFVKRSFHQGLFWSR